AVHRLRQGLRSAESSGGSFLFRVILLSTVGLFLWPGSGVTQLPPDEAWRTIQTEHFRVTYPLGLLDLARRAGERAEAAREALAREFVAPPSGMIDLVVTDHEDISNGYAQVFPSNRIVIFAPAPVDGFSLAHMDEWMELVITHELVHVFHEDFTGPLGTFLRKILGRYPAEWPFFPGSATPGWTVEGIATYYESSLTHAGRVRGTFHEMAVRAAVLDGAFESIDQASGASAVWPGGQRYYIYGSLFLKRMMDRYGEAAMGTFVEAVAGQWIPYRLNAAAEEAFGTSFSQEWAEWKGDLEAEYAALQRSLGRFAPPTRGEALTTGGFYALRPAVSADGLWMAYARSDGRSDTQIRVREQNTGRERKLSRTNRLSNFSWAPGGDLLFSQVEYTDSYRIRGDLFRVADGGSVRQLTRGKRLDHPDVHPDGSRAVAVQEAGGSNRLVFVDLPSGSVTPLTDYASQELWAYPRWSPGGRWIAVSRWRAGAHYDLVIMDPGGQVLHEVTADRAIDNSPAWSPDGRWLLWSSDQSGIPNLYAVRIDRESGAPKGRRQVTNVLGGAAYPSVGPEGEWIYFSSYHADGWRIERIPFDVSTWFSPMPLHRRFTEEGDPRRFERRAAAQEAPYSPVHTLAPTYWSPAFREADESGGARVLEPGFGISTTGEDLVGRHSYELSGTLSRGFGTFSGGGTYTYAGLGNPLFGVSLGQSFDAQSHPLAAPDESGDLLYLVERERQASLGTTLLRRRARSVASLSLAGSYVWEDRTLLDESLKETTRFRLLQPEVRFVEGRVSLSATTARVHSLSISPEDGVSLFLRGRAREHLGLADSLAGGEGFDRSFQDVIAEIRLFKGIRGPGFGNHVFALRVSGGTAWGPGADQGHFEVGGASGAGAPIQLGFLGDQRRFLPVRGYGTAARFGRNAWTATAEYRFPVRMLNRGPGLFPLHFDWVSGALFLDAGNGWGPEVIDVPGFFNPSKDALVSTGGELTMRILPLWFATMDLRLGVAVPLVHSDEGRENRTRVYLRIGPAF
ncbi:hypothetical protein ACFL3S_01725, partial [Gemmatimonadota bacterium]